MTKYQLISHDGVNGSNVARPFESLSVALDMLPKMPFNMLFIEEDSDHPGHYDMMSKEGLHVYSLEPVK